jgi:hypothetical protein
MSPPGIPGARAGGLLHRGKTSFGMLKHMRRSCCVRPVLPPRSAFAGFRFPREVIVLAVRWYLRYGLSYRDVEELLELTNSNQQPELRALGLRNDRSLQILVLLIRRRKILHGLINEYENAA